MTTSRETARDALVTLLTTALVGAGLPVKTVTGSKVEALAGLTPLVAVLSAGTLRERQSFTGDAATFYLDLQVWVMQATTGWTNAEAEDALDRIESLIAGVVETERTATNWALLEFTRPTEVVEVAVAGVPFYLELGQIAAKLVTN